jgi:hypothetical protein
VEIASLFSLFGVKLVELNDGNLGALCLGSEDATEYLALGEERYTSSEQLSSGGVGLWCLVWAENGGKTVLEWV